MLGVLGLVLGSFVNAFVWRVHEQQVAGEGTGDGLRMVQGSDQGQVPGTVNLSILTGRSICTTCHHRLAAKDLIPVLSWLYLRGKCRYCRAPISWQYPAVEIMTALAFLASYAWWPVAFNTSGIFSFSLWLVFLTAFFALAVYDIRWYLLPDRIVFPMIVLAALGLFIQTIFFGIGWHAVAQALVAVICLAGLFFLLHFFSKGAWIGFGDVKLAVVLGILMASPANSMLLLFLAAAIGTVFAIPLLLRGQATAKTQLPFGPFLLFASAIVVLFGGRLIHLYLHLFMIH